ncbi:hypothetical protein SCP_1500550 [Sparassis crispa]|uniref:Uncharacterized protein n=1 Tax=Sparassis crispa TaxID=139825 RepID=A0A401H3S3_9APHY|nr:hypothetical protein SCP_1500550 [Sparassis crispa]GBE89053.1 hypothetical protein SCP_1500550 [Sparassis crispa]
MSMPPSCHFTFQPSPSNPELTLPDFAHGSFYDAEGLPDIYADAPNTYLSWGSSDVQPSLEDTLSRGAAEAQFHAVSLLGQYGADQHTRTARPHIPA